MKSPKLPSLNGNKIIIIGFGAIGPAVLPLILKHIDVSPEQVTVIAADDSNRQIAANFGIQFEQIKLTPDNYRNVIGSRLTSGSILINLSVQVSSLDLVDLCQEIGSLYLDTSNEAWPSNGGVQPLTTFGRRSKTLRESKRFAGHSTALLYHGANPGLVSHFAKRAVIDVAKHLGCMTGAVPTERREWALLAKRCGIVALHISERDTQYSHVRQEVNEFVNTWSVDGFIEEATEHAGLAWGTHERELPKHIIKTKHETESCHAVELVQSGASVPIRSWVPSCGTFDAYVISHPEAFSIAELFSLSEDGERVYQPTVHFSYQPCSEALFSMRQVRRRGHNWVASKRLLLREVIGGSDELGVLVLRKDDNNIYWFGSRLSIQEARQLVPNNNATSLQVAAGILGGLVWVLENPKAGVVEPEDIDFERVLGIATPYLGELSGYWARWVPTHDVPMISPTWQFSDLAIRLG